MLSSQQPAPEFLLGRELLLFWENTWTSTTGQR